MKVHDVRVGRLEPRLFGTDRHLDSGRRQDALPHSNSDDEFRTLLYVITAVSRDSCKLLEFVAYDKVSCASGINARFSPFPFSHHSLLTTTNMVPQTHKAIATTGLGVFDEIDVETGVPQAGEVLLKVEYTSMIAFDTYQTDLGYVVDEYPHILGFNAAGTVAVVGANVEGLKVGDRVRDSVYTFILPTQ